MGGIIGSGIGRLIEPEAARIGVAKCDGDKEAAKDECALVLEDKYMTMEYVNDVKR